MFIKLLFRIRLCNLSSDAVVQNVNVISSPICKVLCFKKHHRVSPIKFFYARYISISSYTINKITFILNTITTIIIIIIIIIIIFSFNITIIIIIIIIVIITILIKSAIAIIIFSFVLLFFDIRSSCVTFMFAFICVLFNYLFFIVYWVFIQYFVDKYLYWAFVIGISFFEKLWYFQ